MGKLEAPWNRKLQSFIAPDPLQILGVSEGLQLREGLEDGADGEPARPVAEASGAKVRDANRVRYRNDVGVASDLEVRCSRFSVSGR